MDVTGADINKPTPEDSPTESTSLLQKQNSHDEQDETQVPSQDGEIYDLEDEGTSAVRKILDEFVLLLRTSIPVILAYSLQNSLQTFSVLIVGRTSPEDLATAAFSYMFAMCTAWLIALGGTTALDTLCSSAFTGSKNQHELGILLQRSFFVLGLLYVPICILWFFSEKLFLALGQEPQIARDSAKFLSYLIPGGLGYIYFEALKKFLQAQGAWTTHVRVKPLLTRERNHEARDIRATHHVSN